ncbi:arylsulfatase [Marinifilum sp. JC070]|uniref:Arylsulfatase n=2 Tax=Marinifilum caeruleilacunae TaxID=2499076 RepID=A0ABX1WYV3_9BACT|nr:arylsulfatase [Marinifilum caeruleilacunae]
MYDLIKNYLLTSLFALTVLSGCAPNSNEKKKPNVIFILADDLGYETIGVNGGESYETPEIDQMANEGMRFEHCYAQPLCTPSRVKLMTGIYNVRNYVSFGLLHTSQTSFGHLFRKNGYRTCVAGKWQLGKKPDGPYNAGFDHHCLWQFQEGRTDSTGRDTRYAKPVLEIDGELTNFSNGEYGPEIVSDYGIDFIEKSHKEGKPFLLYYPMMLTHCPFTATPSSPEWETDDTTAYTYKGKASYFDDMVSETDRIVGKINSKLKELGIEDNTLVIFTGDNGTDQPIVSIMNGKQVAGGKWLSTDAGTRVPLIVKWPNVISKSECNDLIDFCDFFPTICEAASIPVPDSLDIDGRSFYPQLKGEKGQARKWVYNWFSRSGESRKARVFARNHRYKLYTTGEFYEIPKDREEKHALNIDTVNKAIRGEYEMLKEVLDYYEGRRLDKIPGSSEK